MTDRLLSILAFLVLLGFLAPLALKVGRLDLGAVIVVTVLLVALDFWRDFRRRD